MVLCTVFVGIATLTSMSLELLYVIPLHPYFNIYFDTNDERN